MSALGKARSPGEAVASIVGTLGGIATIATWLNVTPETVGGYAFAALNNALPIASFAFGIVAGWGLRGLAKPSARRERADATEEGTCGEFAKVGSPPRTLPPSAMRALSELDEAESACMVALANLSAVDESGDPEKPLFVIPVSERCASLGVDAEAVSRLVERGLLTRSAARRVVTVGTRKIGERWVDAVSPCEDAPSIRTMTWSSSGDLTPMFLAGSPSRLVYPESPVKFTSTGKEVARICARKSITDAVERFNEEWHARAAEIGPMRM